MFRHLQLKVKLTMLFLLMALIVAVTGGFGLWGQNQIKTLLEGQKSSAAQEKLAVLMKVTLQGARVNLLEAAMTQHNTDDFDNSKIDYELKRDSFNSYCTILQKGHPKLNIPAAPSGSELFKRVSKVSESFQAFDKVAVDVLGLKEALMGGAEDDGRLTGLLRETLPQVVDEVSLTVDDLLVEVRSMATQHDRTATAIQEKSKVYFIAVIVGAILLAVLLGLLTTGSILGRINLLVRSLKRGAEGDLTAKVKVNSTDELGRLGGDFNHMLEKLAAMLAKVKGSTDDLGKVGLRIQSAAREVIATAEVQQQGIDGTSAAILNINDSQQGISHAVDSLSRSAEDTSMAIRNMISSVEEVARNTESLSNSAAHVSSAIVEMDATIKQIERNADDLKTASVTTSSSIAEMDATIQEVEVNARETAEISAGVHEDAETGQQSVQATIQGIQEIRNTSQLAAESISQLSRSVDDIGLVLSVINSVTEETRLLSLNASIIAAQSGEYGRGFAVVADEIRSLAERTNESTQEIDSLINRVQQETRMAVAAIRGAEGKIAEGQALSQKSGEALKQIVAGVEQASTRVNGIARATREQARGSQIIRETMEQVADMINQIAVSTHQQARASEQIMQEVERMSAMTGMVRDATNKQNSDGGMISQLTEEISQMIERIRVACSDQAEGGRQIVEAVANIQESTRNNLDSAKVMGDSLNDLSSQIVNLEGEVVQFKI